MRTREDLVARMTERKREKAERERLEKHKRQLEELGKKRNKTWKRTTETQDNSLDN